MTLIYNALNQRVGQHYDANANGSVGSEDPWLNFVYDDKWRIVATVRGSGGTNGNQTIESSSKELFVYHNAGLRYCQILWTPADHAAARSGV